VSDTGKLTSTDKKKAEILNNIFVSFFCDNCLSRRPQMFGLVGGDWGSNISPTVSEEQARDHLRNVNICKSMSPNEMHPRVLRELTDVVIKPFSTIFENFWQPGEVPGDWKKGNI